MVNRVTLIGRVGKDPEIKHLDGDRTVVNFTLATSEKYKDKETTEWHRIVIWGKLAEVVEKYVHKGDLLYLEGRIQSREYEKDGQKQRAYEIIANQMKMLGGKGGGQHQEKPADDDFVPEQDDDIPL